LLLRRRRDEFSEDTETGAGFGQATVSCTELDAMHCRDGQMESIATSQSRLASIREGCRETEAFRRDRQAFEFSREQVSEDSERSFPSLGIKRPASQLHG
jgi:hypothetical protein